MRPEAPADTHAERDELTAALDTLERLGRHGFTDRDGISRGRAIGFALFAALEPHVIFEAAVEALQQWNAHVLVAVMLAVRCGRWGHHRGDAPNGSVTREGRNVRIKLPRWWAEF